MHLQLMCTGPQVDALISQLRAQASSCVVGDTGGSADSGTSAGDRVFAHEDENLSIEPVLLAQCVAHAVHSLRNTHALALQNSLRMDALQAAQDLQRLLVQLRTLSVASVTHCGGSLRHPARCARRDAQARCQRLLCCNFSSYEFVRYAAVAASIALVQVAVCLAPASQTVQFAAIIQECADIT